jgi:hypothetical protein
MARSDVASGTRRGNVQQDWSTLASMLEELPNASEKV